ncbi:AN1-type zinc finger protein 3 isoform X1 [Coregonus clupeaformis]|uniref:AN1-type zinc finger protein 3 n=2 Tax=Coregonus TaxID=27772 RepID=A0AAN8KU88_9TELE|nr:AN1-type zinc finger protein 3 isoform X1 [Coregonus clupeaformis]XP_041721033.1 AN1-type zinc finger protein 3 isoform X1 [Coregonus clupeaformis]XP_041721034.1 AN1-type zinc finger protein 3 isoform X1 [Coregonus clupeaformis]
MGDTGSERSKPLPPRCPCGFWGSSKTMNLCSKCFADIEQKQTDEDCTSKPSPSTGSSQSAVFSGETSSNGSQSLSSSPPTSSEQPSVSTEDPVPTLSPTQEGVSSCTETAQGTLCTPTKRPCESASGSESEASPEKRARRDLEGEAASEEPSRGPKQKNRRRCYRCQTKLELVQQELGSCRCGYVFCMLHRLPEQHDCLFDHLGRGREEAVLKMVKLDRKVGRSCQRIGEECS